MTKPQRVEVNVISCSASSDHQILPTTGPTTSRQYFKTSHWKRDGKEEKQRKEKNKKIRKKERRERMRKKTEKERAIGGERRERKRGR